MTRAGLAVIFWRVNGLQAAPGIVLVTLFAFRRLGLSLVHLLRREAGGLSVHPLFHVFSLFLPSTAKGTVQVDDADELIAANLRQSKFGVE